MAVATFVSGPMVTRVISPGLASTVSTSSETASASSPAGSIIFVICFDPFRRSSQFV